MAPGTTAIDPDAILRRDDFGAPATFEFLVRVLDASADGLLFDMGTMLRGTAIWLNTNGRLGMSAGTESDPASTPPKPSVAQETAEGVLPVGPVHRIVGAVRPGDGTIRAWVNGQEVINGRASDGTFGSSGVPSVWTAIGQGSYFAEPVSPHNGALVKTIPQGVDALSDLSIYVDQRPRHYNTGPQDPGLPNP